MRCSSWTCLPRVVGHGGAPAAGLDRLAQGVELEHAAGAPHEPEVQGAGDRHEQHQARQRVAEEPPGDQPDPRVAEGRLPGRQPPARPERVEPQQDPQLDQRGGVLEQHAGHPGERGAGDAMRGTSSRLRPILTITAPAALSRFHELLPPISSITVTLPVARLNSIPSDSTSSAELPATNSGPKMRSTTGPNTASVRYSGQHSVMIHQVPTW